MPLITDPNEPYFKDGTWGWDGATWHRLPMVWGYSDRWVEYVWGIAAGAGNAVAVTTAVPEGYVYVLQTFSFYHNSAAAKACNVYLRSTGDDCLVFQDLTVTQNEWQVTRCEYVLKYQDYLELTVTAPGDGKVANLQVWGYKMLVAE